MNIVIDQPGGLGDVFFIQKLCSVLSEDNVVYHPIIPTCWSAGVDQLITTTKIGPKGTLDIPYDNVKVINLSQVPMVRGSWDVMSSKYIAFDVSYDDWQDYFKYQRNYDREENLKKFLGLENGDPFILVNPFYSVYKVMGGVYNQIPEKYDGKIIEMNPNIPGGKIFDWCWVFENAEEIHSVDTSIHYIIETLDIKSKRLTIHPRHYKYSERVYDGILKKPWEWIQYTRDEWKEVNSIEIE
jgi:hypothetical protein